jgi:uncharacterized OsmC-like protein
MLRTGRIGFAGRNAHLSLLVGFDKKILRFYHRMMVMKRLDGGMITFSAQVQNAENQHQVVLKTANDTHSIVIPPKATGFGSSMNGGEALLLALATCCCNDIYREAKKRGINVRQVIVRADADHDGQDGHPMENIVYHVTVEADAPADEIEALIRHTDTVTEIQNTLRQGVSVRLGDVNAASGETMS